jgi:hypothetical protein
MKKLSVKDLVNFRQKSDRSKRTFIEKLKSTKLDPPTEGGGDYWVTGLSAVRNSYKDNDITIIDEKIAELQAKWSATKFTITKNMYQKNITILQKYKSMDRKGLRPSSKLSFLKRSAGKPVLTIRGLEIETKASHVYTFGKKDEESIGAIWFVAQKDGYRIDDVGLFCEMLNRFLRHNYAKKYELTSDYCIAVDMITGNRVNYAQIEDGDIPSVLIPTLDEINKYI